MINTTYATLFLMDAVFGFGIGFLIGAIMEILERDDGIKD